MSFNFANVKARAEASRRRGELRSPGALASLELGVPGGENGGSVGGVGSVGSVGLSFSSPHVGVSSPVDSEEELFDGVSINPPSTAEKQEKNKVNLVFPLLTGALGVEGEWPWNVCGGLIGGARGNRFCTKPIRDSSHSHCGVGSHAVHKAFIEEGHGYIPSVTDRANTESVFLNPSVNAARFPGAFSELLQQSLTHEEWINSLTVLPTVEEMEESTETGHELVAEVMEKSRHIVSI
jgi:hypothetical protein